MPLLKKKHAICQQFDNKLYQQLGMQLIARHYPDQLSEQQFHYAEQLYRERVDYRGQRRLTWQVCLQEIQTIRKEKTLSKHQTQLLYDYEQWLKSYHNATC